MFVPGVAVDTWLVFAGSFVVFMAAREVRRVEQRASRCYRFVSLLIDCRVLTVNIEVIGILGG